MAPRVINAVPNSIREMGRRPVDLLAGVVGGFSGVVSFANLSEEELVNPTTPTLLTTKYTIPANTMRVGTVIHTRAWGRWVSGVNTSALRLFFYMHAAPQRLLWATPSIGLSFGTVDAGSRYWYGESWAIIRTIGASGTYSYGSVANDGSPNYSVGAAAVSVVSDQGGVNTTLDRDIRITAGVSPDGHADNRVFLGGMVVEVMQALATG